VTCPEQPIVAFLAGELPPEGERRFDEHLLGCEQCWRAVQADRAARLALEQLRQPAPAGLQGRVALAVALAASEAPSGPVVVGQDRAPSFMRKAVASHLRLVAAACLLVVVAAGSFGWLAASRSSAPDPAQVAAVVAMITPGSAPSDALRAGEHLTIGGQPLVVRAYQLEGTEEIVATSARPFPVPPTSHRLKWRPV
jgi:anti-sigma factor RsiW